MGVLEHGRLVQVGTPEEIYTRPATPFVARFTGLAGELPVQVGGRGADGTVLVEPVGGRSFLVRAPAEPLTGQAALVMIRPTGVRLTSNGSDEPHLSGRVTDVAFRGRGYEHAIDIDGTTRLTGVFADVRAARGETVGLRMDPAGCLLFPAQE